MRASKNELPIRLEAGPAIIRGTDWGEMRAAVVSVPTGTDFGPLLKGLPGDLCQAPHWGYVLTGRLRIRYAGGDEELLRAGDFYYMPAGHTGVAEEDTEFLEIVPPGAHQAFLNNAPTETWPLRPPPHREAATSPGTLIISCTAGELAQLTVTLTQGGESGTGHGARARSAEGIALTVWVPASGGRVASASSKLLDADRGRDTRNVAALANPLASSASALAWRGTIRARIHDAAKRKGCDRDRGRFRYRTRDRAAFGSGGCAGRPGRPQ